jgi:hypothetical protein
MAVPGSWMIRSYDAGRRRKPFAERGHHTRRERARRGRQRASNHPEEGNFPSYRQHRRHHPPRPLFCSSTATPLSSLRSSLTRSSHQRTSALTADRWPPCAGDTNPVLHPVEPFSLCWRPTGCAHRHRLLLISNPENKDRPSTVRPPLGPRTHTTSDLQTAR